MSVLAVVTRESEAAALARFGCHVARAEEEKLVVLWIEPGKEDSEPLTLRPGDEVSESAPPAVAAICGELARGARHPELEETPPEEPGDDERLLVEPEVEVVAAPCHTLLVRLDGADARTCERILVPTAGGPHADVALRLGEKLAGACGGAEEITRGVRLSLQSRLNSPGQHAPCLAKLYEPTALQALCALFHARRCSHEIPVTSHRYSGPDLCAGRGAETPGYRPGRDLQLLR